MKTIWRCLSLGGICSQHKPESLSIECWRKQTGLSGSIQYWLSCVGFYCSELGTSKYCNYLVASSRDNIVKQYYFWQNSRLSHSYALVNLLQFLTYLSQMPGISEENKINFLLERVVS